MAYLPSHQIAVAFAATMGENTPDTSRRANATFADIATYLAPDQAPIMGR